jgi:putative hydrolase of the HAD superfamily
MIKKAIIYDLDNTIYPVNSIGDALFEPFLALMQGYPEHDHHIDNIKNDMFRKPFQVVATEYNFNDELSQRGLKLLEQLTYSGPIYYFEDYPLIKTISADRFLVTTGFSNLQYSKIKGMGIGGDFMEIHVVDPLQSSRTKKDVFTEIMQKYGFVADDVLVVGDDPNSEIKAAAELGIDTVLYDKYDRYQQHPALYKIGDFKELAALLAVTG